jgi:protein-tyrosine phosphatase
MSIFQNIFQRNRETFAPIDNYGIFETDIHSHLIPAIDDGSKSMQESLLLIREMMSLGYKKLVTTPHVMSDAFRNTSGSILSELDGLRTAVLKAGLNVTVEAAAEYYMDEHFSELIKSKDLLTIHNKFVLFEVSYVNPPENIMRVIFDLQMAGFTPLLAHPERYPFWHLKFDEYKRLKESGALFQMNTNSLGGYYGAGAKKVAERLIDEDMIDFIGSDMHGMRHIEALKKTLNEKSLHKLATIGVRNKELTR